RSFHLVSYTYSSLLMPLPPPSSTLFPYTTLFRSPVAHVILADDVMALEFEQARKCITDDGGAQVAHVHLFSEVGAGVIDHYGLWRFRRSHLEARVGLCRRHLLPQPLRLEVNVDKPGTSDLHLGGNIVEVEGCHDTCRQLAGVGPHRFGSAHGTIGLIIPETGFLAGGDDRREFGGNATGNHGLVDFLTQ